MSARLGLFRLTLELSGGEAVRLERDVRPSAEPHTLEELQALLVRLRCH